MVSFYFMNSIAVFSVMFSHIFTEKIKFCSNLRSVTHILKLNVSFVLPRMSCNAETKNRLYVRTYHAVSRHEFETYGMT